MKFFKLTLISFILSLLVFSANAQSSNLLSSKDLSTFKVDALTDAEIAQLQQQLKQAGLTIDQVEQQAMAKGMSSAEFAKLRAKLSSTVQSNTNKSPLNKLETKTTTNNKLNANRADTLETVPTKKINPLIYGSELFANSSSGFAVNQNIATPINYVIGPNDVLSLIIYGVQQFTSDLAVTKEGKINIDNVGQVKVSGLTIEAATNVIKNQLAKTAYPSIRSGESKLSLTLNDIRTIQVTVIGAMKSGTMNVSSLSNVLTVLTEAGGPNEIGSYRNIEIIRDNKVFKAIDLYQFMRNGDQSQIVGLKDNDIVRVPPYTNRIELKGQVKRPGIFELKGQETFSTYLQYAGGFDDTAYTALVKVIQKNDKEKAVKDLTAANFTSYIPQGGDVVTISKVIDRFQNRVKLSGATFRPDVYELVPGMRISDLIQKADGLKEDAYLGRAQLIRLKPNLLKELVSINLAKALQGDSKENLVLKREDELYINSVVDLRDSLTVDLLGEVRKEGRFAYIDSMTVKDLILLAGGFNYAADKYVEVARQIQYNDKVNSNKVATILRTQINGDLSFSPGQENFILQPMDVVTITKKAGYAKTEVVTVNGQVQKVGKYTLSSRVDKVSDILKRAGGLIGDAYGEGAYIRRYRYQLDSLKSEETKTSIEEAYNRKFKAQQLAEKENVKKLIGENNSLFDIPNAAERKLKDTLEILFKDLESDYYQIAIDVNKIIQHPGSELDLVLRDKDEIIIPKQDNKIKISGGVLRPTNIVYNDGLNINECISAAGGISEYAKRGRAYVVYANGKSERTKHFGFFRINPKILPGCEIVLPETNEKKDKAITPILQFTTIVAQLASAFVTIRLITK